MAEEPGLTEIVELDWIDSRRTYLGWEKASEYMRETALDVCHSVGYLLKEDDDQITVVQSVARPADNPDRVHAHVTDAITIPKVAVRTRRSLG